MTLVWPLDKFGKLTLAFHVRGTPTDDVLTGIGEPAISADFLYQLIVEKKLFFPIHSQRLAEQEHATIYRDEATFKAFSAFLSQSQTPSSAQNVIVDLDAGTPFTWDGKPWRVINNGASRLSIQEIGENSSNGLAELSFENVIALVREKRITLPSKEAAKLSTDATELLRQASPSHLRVATWKFEILQGAASPDNPLASRQSRSVAYWKSKYRRAEITYGNGFIGLLPRTPGNRKPRASPASAELGQQIIATDWENIRRKGRSTAWGKYTAQAHAAGVQPVSYVTFCKWVKNRRDYKQLASRIGAKAAYELEPQYQELEYTTPRHGVRPWHIAHIDHTPLPLKLIHKSFHKVTWTLWLTLLTDAYSRKVVAYYLSFDEPSYRSCMMVLRDCVRRHNRVPQSVVCDQGSEFNSEYWETQLAICKDRAACRKSKGWERYREDVQNNVDTVRLDVARKHAHGRRIFPAGQP